MGCDVNFYKVNSTVNIDNLPFENFKQLEDIASNFGVCKYPVFFPQLFKDMSIQFGDYAQIPLKEYNYLYSVLVANSDAVIKEITKDQLLSVLEILSAQDTNTRLIAYCTT